MTTLTGHLTIALRLAEWGMPVMPLREGKGPMGNCRACRKNACSGRPNMKTPGSCACPAPCHAWAAATTDPDVLTSPAWAPAWRQAAAVAYHPGGAGVTVVDLDNADAVAWARQNLLATRTVATTRGEHWIYLGTMTSPNAVRPGVDIKSLMSYARWLGSGTGTMGKLPDVVRALAVKEPAAVRPAVSPRDCGGTGRMAGSALTARPPTWNGVSPWRSSGSGRPRTAFTGRCTGCSSRCCLRMAGAAA